MTNTVKSNENDSDASSTTTTESRSQTSSSKKRRSRKLKRGRKTVPAPYKFITSLIETPALQIFAIAFNHFVKNRDIFATASGNKISIYECVEAEDPKPVQLIRVYIEPDKDEVFNCVCWSYENNGLNNAGPLLAAGGVKGVVRVIQCNREPTTGFKNLIGHTGAINDMKFHPVHPHLLLSGSKDYSIRLWNIRNSTCIAIFSGIRGHRDEVLSIDVSADGTRLISGGIDHNVMIWNLTEDDLKDKIEICNGVEGLGRGAANFKAIRVHFPEFSTRDVHGNYVDTVKYFGDTFLSKSCENNIIWWKRKEEALTKGPHITKLFTFDIIDSEIWFMRMEIDLQMSQLAVGSQNGKVFIFNLDTDNPINRRSTLSHSRCTAAVRQMGFSRNGNILVAVCDDGSFWRWDRKEPKGEF